MASVTLNWSDNSDNEDGFEIFRGTSSGSLSSVTTVSAGTTSYEDTGVSEATTYYYRVESYTEHTSASTAEQSITTLPAAPSGTSVDTSVEGEITVSWTDNSSEENGYRVYRSTDGSNFTEVANLGANDTDYVDTGLLDGEQYYYYVAAYNSAGENAGSTVSGTTILPAPSSPLATTQSDTEIGISWTDNSNNEDGFEVFRGTSSGNLSSITTVGSNTTSYSDTELSSNTTYYYRVESYTEHTSSSTAEFSSTTDGMPSIPQNLSSSVTSDNIYLTWDSVDWNGDQGHYNILRGVSSGSYTEIATVSVGTTSYDDTGLLDGERYYYVVTAENTYGTSSQSNETDKTTVLPAPSSPSAITQSNSQIDISWTDNSDNESGFEVFRSTDGSSFSSITTLSANTKTYSDTGLVDGEQYYYYIEAYTEHTTSTSNTVSDITVLPEPSSLDVTDVSPTSIDVAWTDNANNEDGYRVYYREDGTSSWTQFSDLGANTTTETITNLSNDAYEIYVDVYTEHVTSESDTLLTTSATSYVSAFNSFAMNDRTSLELLDYPLTYNESEQTWYTEWGAETKITGNEDTLALVTNVAPQADEPAATLYIEYDEDNDDRAEYRSDPIETVGEQRVREVTGVPVSNEGEYRLLITNYGGYNDLSNINIGLIH